MDDLYFSLLDYILFGSMLALSAIIGLYFGFFSKQKQNTTMEYLLGSKTMKIIPIAISLTATNISAVTLVGVPSEMYRYGTQYWFCGISGLIVTVLMSYVYLPVFFELQTTSCYTYLNLRFGPSLRNLASGIFTLYMILVLPIIVYAPAIAFSQVTGVNLHFITPIMCVICIFYTTFGGVRAVVWADTLQFTAMIGAITVIMYLGTSEVGGFFEVFKIADRGGRIILFDMDTDPFMRSSFWMVSIGLTTMWISALGVTPETVQRYMAVPTLRESRKIVWIFGIGHIIIKYCSIYNGLIIYGKYETCDPVSNGKVEKPDQIFPFYVMDVARSIPGLPGLFVAGVFSAALSTLSSCLNTLAGTIYVDFFKPRFPNTSERSASNIMKILVIFVGAICLGMVFIVEKLGNIFSLGISISGVTAGTLLGIFTMGMICPSANRKGALWGAYVSMVIVGIIAFGAQLQILNGNLKYQSLPFRTDGCDANNKTLFTNNSTIHIINKDHDNSSIFWLFRIGFMYYSVIGFLIVFLVGYPVSRLTGGCDNLDERLLTPWARKLLNRKGTRLNGTKEMDIFNKNDDAAKELLKIERNK